jgi:hypothetical protein
MKAKARGGDMDMEKKEAAATAAGSRVRTAEEIEEMLRRAEERDRRDQKRRYKTHPLQILGPSLFLVVMMLGQKL